MSDTVIRVENLGKKYLIGHHQQERYTALRDVLTNKVKSVGSLIQNRQFKMSHSQEEFWALKDVSFEIKQGDRVGIIGRNGAGKSTLLKILSRITEPTKGSIKIKGRVASLLEVGTGFHPELTGRENIYLNGAILGMSKEEIKRKFDEIVDFAEIEKFLDTPVKRYSSGMYVRLAFAVAAHLEPEILIVDEVLAVGDLEFQNKCLGKMQDVAYSGRTVLFVSHNIAAVRQLCNLGIFMKQGSLVLEGAADQVVNYYLNTAQNQSSFSQTVSRYGIALLKVVLEDADTGNITHSPVFDGNYLLKLNLQANKPLTDAGIVVRIYDNMGSLISSICSVEEGITPFLLKEQVEVNFLIPKLKLFPGQYRASVFLYRSNDHTVYLEAEDALKFEVQPAIVNQAMWAYRNDHGVVRISHEGSIVYL